MFLFKSLIVVAALAAQVLGGSVMDSIKKAADQVSDHANGKPGQSDTKAARVHSRDFTRGIDYGLVPVVRRGGDTQHGHHGGDTQHGQHGGDTQHGQHGGDTQHGGSGSESQRRGYARSIDYGRVFMFERDGETKRGGSGSPRPQPSGSGSPTPQHGGSGSPPKHGGSGSPAPGDTGSGRPRA